MYGRAKVLRIPSLQKVIVFSAFVHQSIINILWAAEYFI